MKRNSHIYPCLALLVLASSAIAQTATTATPNKSTTTAPSTASKPVPASAARQDQFPKASGAIVATPDAAAAAEAKKHVANIKWSDRSASSQQPLDATSKDAAKAPVNTLDGASKDAAKSSIAIDEPGFPKDPKPATNKMAIKENGIYTTPAKPKP